MVRADAPSPIAPNVSSVLDAVLNVGLPVRVVAPNVSPAVPLETLPPAVRLSVCVPILSVPNVCVIPADAAVALSDAMVYVAVTVVL